VTTYDYSVKVECPKCGAKLVRLWRVFGPFPFSYRTVTLVRGRTCPKCGTDVQLPGDAVLSRHIERARTRRVDPNKAYSGRTSRVRALLR